MALAVAQAVKIQHATATSTTGSITWSAGSVGTCWVGANSGTASNFTVSGSVSGAWSSFTGNASTGSSRGRWFYKLNLAAGAETMTINCGVGTAGFNAIFHEGTGTTTSTTPDNGGNTANAAGTNPQTASLTNTTADSLYFAAVCDDAGSNPSTITINSTGSSPASGWAHKSATLSLEQNGNTWDPVSVVNLIVSTAAARVHGWTIESSVSVDGIIAVAIAGGAAAAPVVTPVRMLLGLGL